MKYILAILKFIYFSESGICAKIRGVYGNFMRKFKKEDMVPDGCWLKTWNLEAKKYFNSVIFVDKFSINVSIKQDYF